MLASAVLIVPDCASAQILLGATRAKAASKDDPDNGGRLVLPESSDLNRVLRKVTEFFAQEPPKWDDGVRMMQDMLEGKVFDARLADEQMLNPFYSVYSADRRLYVPFARYCQDLLCELPPEGLASYRFLTDTRAEAAFREAASTMDTAALDRIAQLYYASESGPEIVSLLADMAELEGQLSRAVFLRKRLLETYPDLEDEQRISLLVRQLHTTALLDMPDRHAKIVEALAAYGPDRAIDVAGKKVALARLGEHPAFKLRNASAGPSVSIVGTRPTGLRSTELRKLWRRGFKTADPYFLRQANKNTGNSMVFFGGSMARVLPHQKQHRPGSTVLTWVDAAGAQLVAYKDHDALHVIEALSGKLRREAEGRAVVRRPANRQLRVRIPLTDLELQSVTTDGERLYFTASNRLPSNTGRQGGDNFPYKNALTAVDLASGETVWTAKSAAGIDRVFFRGPPVRYRDHLYAAVRRNAAFGIARLDASTGLIDKVVTIHEGGTDYLRVPGMAPVVIDNRLLYMSNAGAIASLSLPDLELRWLRAYEERSPEEPARKVRRRRKIRGGYYQTQPREIRGWRPRPLIVRDGLVLVAGCESDALMAVDINSGEPVWFLPRVSRGRTQEFDEVIGISNGVVYLAGKNTMQGVVMSSGKRVFETDLTALPRGGISGWSTVAGDSIWAPFEGGAYRFRQEDGVLNGIVEYSKPALGAPDWSALPQRLQFVGSILLSVCESGISAFGSAEDVTATPLSRYELARSYAATGQIEQAFRTTLKALAPDAQLTREEQIRTRNFAVRLAGELASPERVKKDRAAALEAIESCERALARAGMGLDPRLMLFRIATLDPTKQAAEIRSLRNRIAGLSEIELSSLRVQESADGKKPAGGKR